MVCISLPLPGRNHVYVVVVVVDQAAVELGDGASTDQLPTTHLQGGKSALSLSLSLLCILYCLGAMVVKQRKKKILTKRKSKTESDGK